jgi:HEPN domain-containing protein
MTNNDLVQEWYKFAMTDFNSAKYLCDMRPKPLEIICYHCQQSAEKFLKGFLISNNVEAPKIHDLRRLCELCLNINNSFDSLKEICQNLNPYGVQPRYPDEIEILETDAEKALQNVQDMINFFGNQGIELNNIYAL